MKRKILSGIFIFLLLSVLGLLFAGCKSGGDSPENTLPPSENGKGEFIFVCPIMENEYWEACIKGIRRADAELGTATEVIGPLKADNFAVEIVDYMKQALDAHPDGIMTYAGVEGLFPLIDAAKEQGIPVLAVDSDAPNTSRVAYLGTNLYKLGYTSGEALLSLLEGSAKIGYICSSFSAQSEQEVYGAFKDAIQDYDIEVVASAEGQAQPDYAAQAAEEMLTLHPELDAIFCTGGYNATGAARAKEALGREDLVLVGFDDVEENLEFVRKGVIDTLLAQSPEQMGYRSVYLMKEYMENGSLPAESYNTETIIITRENVDSYASAGFTLEGAGKTVRIGYYLGDESFQNGWTDKERKSGYAYEYYMSISALTGWKYEYVYGTREESMERLLSGDVDIVAGVYQTDALTQQLLFSKYDMGMEGEPRYFAVNCNRGDLLSELDSAMEYLQLYSPNFASELRQKYYSSDAGEQMLTERERAWLSHAGSLRAGYVLDNLPLSAQNEEGEPIGVIEELLELFSGYLNLEIIPVCYENVSQMEEGLRLGEIDMAFPIYSDLWLNERKGFLQTDSFLNERVMLVYQGSYNDSLLSNVGLSHTGVGQQYYLQEYYPDVEPTFYNTREDVFEAIEKGEVSCIIGCSSILQYFLSSHSKYRTMNIAYLPSVENFGIAVRQGDNVLVGILNKAIHQIDEAKITDAIVYYSNAHTEPTFVDFLQRYVVAVVAVFAVFFSILLFTFLAYRKKSMEFNQEQAKTQAQLEEALHAAEAASHSKTVFLSSMSHDIRTPMNAIIGMTSIASKHLGEWDKVEDCLKKISLSSHHLLTLINDVLDISKIESGKLALNPVNFSLRDAVSSLISTVHPQIKEKNLHFDAYIRGFGYELVYADEVRINQVFINILSNAVKYTPEGGRIVMELAQELLPDDKQTRLTYTVSDTGIGMSEEYMANMYTTFSRAKDTRINKIQGTGLGLSIVKQMVDLMGGTITCKSKEGEGTTFEVSLTLPIGEMDRERPKLPGLHVLIVDDDEFFLETAKETLLDMEAVPETAVSGREALTLLRQRQSDANPFGAVIVDWKMPDMNGIEMAKRIQDELHLKIPTILVSAYDWSDIEEKADPDVINGFINKLLFPSCIYEKLCNILKELEKDSTEPTSLAQKYGGMHVLVTEDNDLNWEVVSELLEMSEITSQRAENGQICVDMLTDAPEGTYDLVLMDVQMPVMNGKDATRAIRASALPHVRSIPVIAMTADAFAEDVTSCLEAGMDGHIAKPVDMDKLFQEIDKVLGAKKPHEK